MIYLTNGNMPLNAAYADEIVQKENSTYQLSFRFPTSDPLWEKLKEETFLTADDLHGEQDFVIFEVEKKHGYIQVYANQVFTLLNNYVVNPISLDRQTGSTALSRFAGSITRDNPFSFFSDIEDRHTFNIGSKNAMEAFAKDKHSIIGQWGGDLVRHGYQVRLLKNGGSENESLFMYKKNLSSYQQKTSTKSLKTRITFIATVKGEGEKAPNRTFTVTIDSPLINKYSQIYEDVIEVNDQDVKDEASLRKYGEQYYRTSLCDMMEDSLEIEVVGQSDVPVQMFDVVSIFHERYNLDVRKKITKYTYSPMAKKLKSIGFGQFQSGLANAIGNAVSDAVKGEAQQLHDDFERQLARELKNADLAFDRKTEELQNEFTDGLNAAKAKAEEVKRELSDIIDQRFSSFDNGPLQEAKRRSEEALRNAGASSLLAQEAKRIGLDSIAKLEEFKRQATSAQTALSGDLDVLKRTVNNEVNQASEHRRTTTEALSRMTGQMNGFATKSEVAQGIDGLTQTFAKMKVGGRNLIRNYDWNDLLPLNIVGSGWKFERVEDQFAKSRYMLKATCTKAGNVGFHRNLFDLRSDEFQGKDMTWSWEMKTSRPITFYDMGFEAGGLKKNVPISTEWTRITNTFQVAFNRFYSCVFYANGWEVGDVVYIRDPQLEEGTIATTPRPAPEDGKDEILAARTEFKQTADGLSIKMATVENYVSQDGQRQETLRKYTRDETARQVNAVRELVTRDYVGKSTLQESIQGVERRLESYSLGISGNLLKNSNDGFRNQHAKSYRIVETLQANQTYTLVTKYWHGEKSTGHTFSDGSGNLRHLTYNRAIDAWMVQFTPKENISQGTELTLSSHPSDGLGNMAWATLVRGHIPLTYWQPAKSDVEEGITQKLAEYKETIDGRFADITSLISGKANQTDFQRVQETSKLYERIIGSNENDISNKVARMALTNQLFQVEVGKVTRGGRNLIRNYDWNGLLPLQKLGTDWKFERIADKNAKSGYVLKATCTQGGAGGFYKTLFDLSPDEFQGKDMTSSWDMKASRSITFNAMGFEAGGLKRDVPVSTEWTRITNTFKVAFKQYYSCVFYANGWQVGDVVYIRDPQLEEGPIATSPKRAPEDTDEAIRTVQSQLAGSWGVYNKNSVNEIIAGFNLAGRNAGIKAETIRLEGNTLADKLTAIDGYFKRLFVGEGTFATLNADVIRTNSITADKLVMDMAMARRFVSSDLFTDTLAAKEAFINKLRSVVVTATLLEGYRGRIGGFQIGTHDNDPSSFWLTGLDQFKVGMSNGRGREFQTAFWANWGNTWGRPGPLSWYVTLDGKMYCNNDAAFHRVVDFSSTCSVNFYGANSFYKDIYMRNGSEIYGTGSTPRAGSKNSVVWWNQVGDGSLKYHIDMASDKRLKENILDSNIVALDKIKQLKMKSFDFISTGKHEEVGLIAQEVEAILPSVISKNPEKADDYLHIDYVAIVPYLIKSIQELNQKIEEMEKTVA